MAIKEQNLPKLFSQLQVAGKDGDYSRCLKLVEKILVLSPGDSDVLKFKVTCLVHISKFLEALQEIDRIHGCLFEKAYCLYRMERFDESLSILAKLPSSEVHVGELKAQILYKQEDYSQSLSLYTQLSKELSDEWSSDRETNRLAALCLSGGSISSDTNMDTMEKCFNAACCLLGKNQVSKALELLNRCKELSQMTLNEEGATEEEIEEELAIVKLQLGYALQIAGQRDQALELYNSVLRLKSRDITQTVVASNNIVVLNKDRDVFDSKKKIKVLASESDSKRLTSTQKVAILFNRVLFALQTNQLEQSRSLLVALSTHQSSMSVLAQVALLWREKRLDKAIECLEAHVNSQPNSELTCRLTLAQLLISSGHIERASVVLAHCPELPRRIGLVGALVSLYTALDQTDKAGALLDSTAEYWRLKEQSIYQQVLLEAGRYKLKYRPPSEAAEILKPLQHQRPDDIKVTALLISAYSRYNPQVAEELSGSLLASGPNACVDVDALEQTPSFRHSQRQPIKSVKTHTSVQNVPVKKSKTKKHKPRLPKNFDPSVPIDKERWLPLKERSYYRRGKKRGFIGSVRGSQGAASASLMAQLDASKPSSADSGGKTDVTSPKAKPISQQQKKKPKKKKGKW